MKSLNSRAAKRWLVNTNPELAKPPRSALPGEFLGRRWLLNLRDALVLLLLVAGFYWKATLTRQFTLWDNPDLANQVLPWFSFEADQFHHWHFPLWDPHLWSGQPLIGQGQPGVCYPLNWILFAVGLDWPSFHKTVRILDVYMVVIHLMGALFFYALARELNRTRLASIVSGFAFTASAYMGSVIWPQRLNGAVWTPLLFLFFVRVCRGREVLRSAALSGAFLGVAFLSGHHEAPTFMALAIGFSWLYLLWEERRSPRLLGLLGASIVFALFVASISAAQAIPLIEYGRLAMRWVGTTAVDWKGTVPYSMHSQFSLGARSLIGIVIPWFSEHAPPFLGWTGLTLAALGLIAHWSDKEVKYFFSLALGGLLFSLGRNNVVHGVMYGSLPMVEKARMPAYAMLLFGFGACVLLAYGLDAMRAFNVASAIWARRILAVLITASAVLTISTLFFVAFAANSLDPNMEVLSGFAALGLAGILYACWHSAIEPRTAQVLTTLLLAIELGNVGLLNYRAIDQGWPILDQLSKFSDVADFVKSQNDGGRLDVDSSVIAFNLGDQYRVDAYGEYLASVTRNVFWLDSQNPYWSRMLFATKYYAGKKPAWPREEPVFTSRDGVLIYRNLDALPRTWITHRVVGVTQAEGARRVLAGEKLREEPFMFGRAPVLESCTESESATVAWPDADKEVIIANAACRGLLIVADTYVPGWSVQVDGKAGKIVEVYGALRATEIPAGRHTVVFRYLPLSAAAGIVITVLGFTALAVLVIWPRPAEAKELRNNA
jgi:hypothetical protein